MFSAYDVVSARDVLLCSVRNVVRPDATDCVPVGGVKSCHVLLSGLDSETLALRLSPVPVVSLSLSVTDDPRDVPSLASHSIV